jgi:hypothetical protein
MNRLRLSRWLWLAGLLSLLVFTSQVTAQTGGAYDLTWNTVDAGGGQNTGGLYSLDGTIGQPDAGQMGGGVYILGNGFWGGTIVPVAQYNTLFLPLLMK